MEWLSVELVIFFATVAWAVLTLYIRSKIESALKEHESRETKNMNRVLGEITAFRAHLDGYQRATEARLTDMDARYDRIAETVARVDGFLSARTGSWAKIKRDAEGG